VDGALELRELVPDFRNPGSLSRLAENDRDSVFLQRSGFLRVKGNLLKTDVVAIKTEQAVQSGKLDLIIQRLNSPVEQERKDGIIWNELRSAVKSWKGWAMIIFILVAIALAGDKILQLLGWLPTGV
jgi:hypothetical protein